MPNDSIFGYTSLARDFIAGTRANQTPEERRESTEWRVSRLDRNQIIDIWTTRTNYMRVRVVRTDGVGIGFMEGNNFHFVSWHAVEEIITPVDYEE